MELSRSQRDDAENKKQRLVSLCFFVLWLFLFYRLLAQLSSLFQQRRSWRCFSAVSGAAWKQQAACRRPSPLLSSTFYQNNSGCRGAAKLASSQVLAWAIPGSSKNRAPAGQALTQAQQRMQPGSVTEGSSPWTTPMGQI